MTTRAEHPLDLLGRVGIFAGLAPHDLRHVAEVAMPRRFAAGGAVFRAGDASDTCYVVRSGRARAFVEHPDGRQITLSTFGSGDIFGELAMLSREPRSATVEAVAALDTLAIAAADMRRLMDRHPQIPEQLVVFLARRLRAANDRLARQSFQTVQSRVASVLGQLVEQARAEGGGRGDGNGGPVTVTTTQADVAKLAGSSRESASRFLAVLERAGVITQGRGRIVVHEPAALEGYVY